MSHRIRLSTIEKLHRAKPENLLRFGRYLAKHDPSIRLPSDGCLYCRMQLIAQLVRRRVRL
jgi:hypothetical protein